MLFDLYYSTIPYRQSITFTQYYGATDSEADAEAALALVGADAWSFGQSRHASLAANGTPATFIWGYRHQP